MKKSYIALLMFLVPFLNGLAQQTYTNPVVKPGKFNGTNVGGIADPGVFKDTDGTYYMYVTGKGIPTFSSKDLVNWKFEKKVFTGDDCKWSVTSFWAPEVVKIGSKYYLHYTGAKSNQDPKRIGMAVSNSPLGPFVDLDDAPFFEHSENKGCIDSHIFFDDDKRIYMYYSVAMSTNPIPGTDKKRSEIWVVELADDMLSTAGTPRMLIYPTQEWENRPEAKQYWNEGSAVLKHNGTYYLMYSANCFCAPNYAIGYATSKSPLGPFTKFAGNPVLSNKTNKAVSGPGHHAVVASPDGTELYCVYHSHYNFNNSEETRMVNIDKMGFRDNGELYIDGPSTTPQPYPSNKKK